MHLENTNSIDASTSVAGLQRRAPRFACDGEVVFTDIPATGLRRGKLRILGQYGCFITTTQPFAISEQLDITVYVGEFCLRMTGIVRSLNDSGMGVEFNLGVSPETDNQLLALVEKVESSTLRHEPAVLPI